MKLTPDEQQICESIGFEIAVGQLLKEATGQPLYQLQGLDGATYSLQPVTGLASLVHENQASQITKTLSAQLPQGYLVFTCGGIHNFGKSEIALLKTDDPLDIVRLKGTNGGNYEVYNEHVIARLQEWQTRYGLSILGAAHDWVTIEFVNLPDDLSALAQEIYDFCPDTISQHFGCFGEMVESYEEMGEDLPEHVAELIEGLDWDDHIAAGLEVLQRSLRKNKSLMLWWD